MRGRQNPEQLSVSHDGEFIATIHSDDSASIWKWRDALRIVEPRTVVRSHPAGDRQPRICYLPDGKTVAVTSARTPQNRGGGSVTHAAVGGAAKEVDDGVAAQSRQAPPGVIVLLVDASTGKLQGQLSSMAHRHLQLPHDDVKAISRIERFTAIATSPDGQWLAAASDNNHVLIWNLPQQRLERILPIRYAIDVAFSPDERQLAVVTDFWDAHRINIRDDWSTSQLPGNFGKSICYTPSGQNLLSGLSMYEAKGGEVVFKSTNSRGGYYRDITCAADGNRAYAIYGNAVVRWELADARFSYPFPFHSGNNNVSTMDLALSPQGSVLATATTDAAIRLWNTATGALSVTLKGHTATVDSIAFAPDGKTLASVGSDGTTRFWNVEQFTLAAQGAAQDEIPVAPLPTAREIELPNGVRIKVIFDRAASIEEIEAAMVEAIETIRAAQ